MSVCQAPAQANFILATRINWGMDKITTHKFDPEEHRGNAYEAFCEFVEEFTYEYAAIRKDPPKDMPDAEKTAWKAQKKKDVFLGKFASRNLQKNF